MLDCRLEEIKIVVPRGSEKATALGVRFGMCECGTAVCSSENYCRECGSKLDWRYCHED